MKKQIIVLENDPDICLIIEYILKGELFNVRTYSSADDFWGDLEYCDADLLLMDISLLDESGIDLPHRLKLANASEIPIILMSVVYPPATTLPAQDFIRKPFDIDDLVEKVKKQLGLP